MTQKSAVLSSTHCLDSILVDRIKKEKKRSHKKRTRDLWNTRRGIQTQTKLDQPSWKNGQHQTAETRPQLQTSRKKRSWTPQETMAMRRCRNSSNDLIHGGRWWRLWPLLSLDLNPCDFLLACHFKVTVTVLALKSSERFIRDVFNTLRELRGVTLIP